MTVSFFECLIAIAVAVLIGGMLGIFIGRDLACQKATMLATDARTGMAWIPGPAKAKVNDMVYGATWLKDRVCEGAE